VRSVHGVCSAFAPLRWTNATAVAAPRRFGLFGISLAKIFLYDPPALTSITRALSFLAVGAALLLGGFFYQRLLETKT
jgi:uncharacterized membrane protein